MGTGVMCANGENRVCPVEELPEYESQTSGYQRKSPVVDMQDIVGKCDILFICLDALRYDVAIREEKSGNTPILNQYGEWEKRHAPGTFT